MEKLFIELTPVNLALEEVTAPNHYKKPGFYYNTDEHGNNQIVYNSPTPEFLPTLLWDDANTPDFKNHVKPVEDREPKPPEFKAEPIAPPQGYLEAAKTAAPVFSLDDILKVIAVTQNPRIVNDIIITDKVTREN